MSVPVLIGLHITKCAGTTLATHVRRHLPPKSWYICSSFWNMACESAVEFPERLDPGEVRFVFGHYVHESLLKIFEAKRTIWFTGVRDPIERAVSEYYQICKVRDQAGQAPIDAQEFLRIRKDTMCHEFLRAFPTIAAHGTGGLAERAFAVSELFDAIYDVESFEETAPRLLALLGVRDMDMERVNVRPSEGDHSEFLSEQAAMIAERSADHFAGDLELYAAIAPRLGQWAPANPRGSEADWRERILARSAGLADFRDHLAGFFARDFRNVGQRVRLSEHIAQKRAWLEALEHAEEELSD